MSTAARKLFLLTAALLVAAVAGPAAAQIDLRFSPPDATVEPGAGMRLSVMLDDAIHFRTIELTVTYDPALLSSVSGGQGTLFSDSGLFVMEGFEESVPGRWHGFAVIMGATDSLAGPGELFAWEVEGLIEGTSAIAVEDIRLYRPNGTLISDVGLGDTTVRVRYAPTAVGEVPTYRTDLTLYPNPFNPRTRIGFDLPEAGQVMLSVYDAQGRRVAVLHEGYAETGALRFDWDGRSDTGTPQPGGVYLFRLETRAGGVTRTATTKGILLK